MKRKLVDYFPKSLLILLCIYFVIRLLHLTVLPIFTDESIYIYWAKIIATTHSQLFISLTDGKPPLLIWMIAVLLKILPSSAYLIAGRLPSVLAGGISVFFVYQLAELLSGNRRVALITGVLYILFPFALLYDRMALFDSPLQAMLLAATYFAVLTAQENKMKFAVLWGICLGLAFLFKPTAILFLGLLPAGIVILSLSKKMDWKRLVVNTIIASVIAEGLNNLQRVSHVYFMMAQKNSQFQQPISELLKNPFELTNGNLHGLFGWIIGYYTLPFFVVGMVALVCLLIKQTRIGLLLGALWFVPIFALATVGREIFPRYILFVTPYFLLAVAYLFVKVFEQSKKLRWAVVVLGVIFILPFVKNDYFLLTNPAKAAIPDTDYQQLVSQHPSGYGVDKIYQFLDARIAQGKHVTLVTQGTFGLYPYAFNLEYWDNSHISIVPRWPLTKIDPDIVNLSKKGEVYILLKEYDAIPANLPVDLILKSEKPGGEYPLLLTELRGANNK